MSQPVLPPVYFLAGIVIMIGLDIFFPGARVLSRPWTLIAIAPIAVGVALNIAADRAFQRRETTVKPFEVSTSLVTDGVYGFSRNPMYLGMALILFGVALALGALTPFAVCAAFALLMRYRFIQIEERMLADTFGDEWRRYSAKICRWV